MDVTAPPLAGMMPNLRGRPLPVAPPAAGSGAAVANHVCGGAGACATCSAGGGIGAAAMPVAGIADGPDLLLASGVRIRRRRIGAATVSQAELAQAVRGVQLLPIQHQLLLARLGIPIELVPTPQLEGSSHGSGQPVLGLTTIERDGSGPASPTRLRIATKSPTVGMNPRNAIGEVVQHEIGHVIAVTARQDQSEAAAIRYAASY